MVDEFVLESDSSQPSRPPAGEPFSPRSSTSSGDIAVDSPSPSRKLSFLNGLALIIGLQFGSGIFSAPAQVSQHVPAPGFGVLVWFVAGLLVWTGAASLIELALEVVQNGGIQEYLRYCYGDFMGFLFTWMWVGIAKPAAMAAIAGIFAEHLCSALLPVHWISTWLLKGVGVFGVLAVTLANCTGVKAGAKVANVFLVLKVVTVYSVFVIGIIAYWLQLGHGVGSPDGPSTWFESDWEPLPLWTQVGNYVTAIFGALFCYSGWESIGFFHADMAHPERDLPRVLKCALAIVVAGFVSMNIALYLTMPISDMRRDTTVVVEFGFQRFGAAGGLLYSLAVAASAMGALNSNVFATAILCVAASERRYFPEILANLHCSPTSDESDYYRTALKDFPTWLQYSVLEFAKFTASLRLHSKVPIYAMMLNASLSSLYIIIGTFNSLITFIGISQYLIFFTAIAGIFFLRLRQNRRTDETHGYRTWTGNPIIFCILSAVIVLRGVITNWFQGLAVLAVILAGWAVYSIKFRKSILS